jgi:hypothetical protein
VNELLTKVLDAHGGLQRWHSYNKVEATIVSGVGLFALKGILQDANPRRMTAWPHESARPSHPAELLISARCSRQTGSLSRNSMGPSSPSGAPPEDSFAGQQMHTPWDAV